MCGKTARKRVAKNNGEALPAFKADGKRTIAGRPLHEINYKNYIHTHAYTRAR